MNSVYLASDIFSEQYLIRSKNPEDVRWWDVFDSNLPTESTFREYKDYIKKWCKEEHLNFKHLIKSRYDEDLLRELTK